MDEMHTASAGRLSMDESVFRMKKFATLAILLVVAALTFGTLGVMIAFVLSTPRSFYLVVILASAPVGATLTYALVHFVFVHLRIALASVSVEGVVPRKWTASDVLRRRNIIPWSEIVDVRIGQHPRGPWWITFTLHDGGFRYIRSGKGVPDELPTICEQIAKLRGVPVFHEAL